VSTGVVMKETKVMSDLLLRLYVRVTTGGRERGDVPGWVLITIMTAGLVTVLWAVAGPKFADLFSNAIDAVTGPKS
jgi:hypothetical protein